jgi:hypothetical protein
MGVHAVHQRGAREGTAGEGEAVIWGVAIKRGA